MKKKINLKLIGTASVLTVGIITGVVVGNSLIVGSSSVKPGTVNDPVVTKSYVDEQISKLQGGTGSSSGGSGSSATTAALEVVEVLKGQTLMVMAGSEVVVRAGKAVAYSSDANGLSDVTAGVDIKSGEAVPSNHLIWFPRDGRGIQVDSSSKTSLTVLVKGPYYIQ